jgi:hypothetical protein
MFASRITRVRGGLLVVVLVGCCAATGLRPKAVETLADRERPSNRSGRHVRPRWLVACSACKKIPQKIGGSLRSSLRRPA